MFKFSAKLEMFNVEKKVDDALGYGQFVLDNLVLKGSNYYIPVDEHNLEKSGVTHSRIGKGEIGWSTPYARRLYYNPQYNFSTDKNPNAQGLWFEAAKAKDLQEWLDQAQKATRSKI